MSDLCEHRMRREWDDAPALEKAFYAEMEATRLWEEVERATAAHLRAKAEADRWLAEARAATPPVTSWEIAHGTLTLEDGRIRYRPRPDTPYHIRLQEAHQS